MIQQIILSSLCLIWSIASTAQILKVDKTNVDADTSGVFMGSLKADFNLNNRSATAEQNITYTGLKASADLVYLGQQHAYILINQLNYFKTTGGPLFSTGYTHFRINFLRKNKLSYELFTQVQYDEGRKMTLRYLNGGNFRFQLVNNKKTRLHLGVGAMHEQENWKNLADESMLIKKDIFKSTNYINYQQKLNDFVNLNLIAYYQGGYDQESSVFRNRISGDFDLNVKLTDKLAFNTSFTAQYEDRPIIPINNWVYSLTNGLKYSF